MNMKEIKNILLLSFVLLLFSSCEELFNTRSGQEIRFSVSSGNDIMTRTSYSGETAGNKERIDWVTGDEVAVYLYLNNAPGYTFSNTFSDYIVKLSGQEGYISKGTLASKYDGDGNSLTTLKWVGDDVNQVGHRFYSVYPADYFGSLNEVEVDGGKKIKVDFTGLANQATVANDQIMNYAYMAAAAPKVYYAKDNEKVDLNYYPMVTTIYVKLVNESTETLSPTVKIKAKEGTTPLAGPFSVWLNGDGNFTPEIVLPDSESDSNLGFVQELERTVSVAGKTEDPGTAEAIFFLLPTAYSGENITLSLSGGKNTSEWNLNEERVKLTTLTAFHKYNLTIKIDKDGGVKPPKFEDLSVGGVQMLVEYLNYLENSNKQLFEEYLAAVGIKNDGNKWVNAVFNQVIKNNNSGTLSAEDWLAQIKQLDEELKTKDPTQNPTESKLLELFQYLFDNVTDLTIIGNHGITANLQPQDFQIYKNLQTINIHLENGTNSIEFEEMSSLTSITITGNVGKLDIKVKKCKKLNTIDVTALDQNSDRTITIDECSSVNIEKNNNRWTITIDGVVQ